jgi:hypothetical protein
MEEKKAFAFFVRVKWQPTRVDYFSSQIGIVRTYLLPVGLGCSPSIILFAFSLAVGPSTTNSNNQQQQPTATTVSQPAARQLLRVSCLQSPGSVNVCWSGRNAIS